jgi:hypothetical protein
LTQDLSRYRGYALESSLESVVSTSGVSSNDIKTLHARPSKIQEIEWRAPYASSDESMADPVRGAVFSFFDGALYQIVVRYDRDRTGGLTNSDVIESLSTVYGTPARGTATNPASAAVPDSVLVALWDSPDSSIALVRGEYSSEFHLVLTSKPLTMRARQAIRESGRLDVLEAPRRELERRKQELVDRDAARTTNKAAFRP